MSGFKLFLDSDYSSYKSVDTSPTDLNFNIGNVLSDNYDVYRLSLLEVSCPNIEPTFQTSQNTSLVFRENGGAIDFTATITQGTYNGTDLATEIAARMNSVVGIANTYSCAYNQSTLKLTITCNIPNTFSIRSSSTCLQELGFPTANTSFAVSQTSSYIVNLVGSRYMDITINHNTQSLSTGSVQRTNILARVKWEVPKGSIQLYQTQIPMSHNVSRTSLSSMEIRFYNDKGRQMSLDPNHRITLTLMIEPVQ
jgi:hypothetical protein